MFLSNACQERFLSTLVKNQSTVSIFLKNGIRLTGKISGVGRDVIFLNNPSTQMIYKRRVSTILPEQKIT